MGSAGTTLLDAKGIEARETTLTPKITPFKT